MGQNPHRTNIMVNNKAGETMEKTEEQCNFNSKNIDNEATSEISTAEDIITYLENSKERHAEDIDLVFLAFTRDEINFIIEALKKDGK